METNGVQWGISHTILRVKESFQMSPAGANTIIPFDTLTCLAPDGMRVGVLSWVLKIRGTSYSVATEANTVIDGCSLAQFLQQVSIKLADGTPPSRFDGGDLLVQLMDGYRALQGLSDLSRLPSIWLAEAGDNRLDLFSAPGGASVAPAAAQAPIAGTNTAGYLQNCFPYYVTGDAASSLSRDIIFMFHVGVQHGEPHGSCAIPGNWFTGKKAGCDSTGPGYLSVTLGTSIDGNTITWGSSIIADLYALVTYYNLGDQPTPPTPKIRNVLTSDSDIKLPAKGINKHVSFCPPLGSDGAMATVTYERVEITTSGYMPTESQINLNRWVQTLFNAQGEGLGGFHMPLSQAALTGRQAARYTRHCEPLWCYPDSNVHAPGSINEVPLIKVVASTTTTHNVLQVALNPITPEVKAAADEWSAIPNAANESGYSTSNGNTPKTFTGKGQLVPNVIEAPVQVVMKNSQKAQ